MSANRRWLRPAARPSAEDHYEAWRCFKRRMRGKQYGTEELSDAWAWFLMGWTTGEHSS